MSKSIEEIKVELMMKVLNGSFNFREDIIHLPKDDDLREFVCKINCGCAYHYALYVDKCPHEVTRKSSCKDPEYAYFYAVHVDGFSTELTRKAACKDPCSSYEYALFVDKCARNDTREGAYKDPDWKMAYINEFGK